MRIVRFRSAESYEPQKDWRRVSLCSEKDISIEHFTKPPHHEAPRHEHPNAQVLVVLQGKVSIKWIIQADGTATNPQVEGSATTLENAQIHECMMSRITSWQFPKPKGGGIAVITYPWILRASGNTE